MFTSDNGPGEDGVASSGAEVGKQSDRGAQVRLGGPLDFCFLNEETDVCSLMKQTKNGGDLALIKKQFK